jgi:hypothetical protein
MDAISHSCPVPNVHDHNIETIKLFQNRINFLLVYKRQKANLLEHNSAFNSLFSYNHNNNAFIQKSITIENIIDKIHRNYKIE